MLRAELAELRAQNAELRRGHALLSEQVLVQRELIGTQEAQLQTLDQVRGLLEEDNRRLAERVAELKRRLRADHGNYFRRRDL